ncbi:MAG: hypothetical protein M3Q57_05730 [Pseudomonadota bacterium]|nr:hypothetical protein [Pseudomonadota bacterium]
MSRYRVFFVAFMIASLFAAGWLLLAVVDYSTSAFDCNIPGLYGADCADAAASQIAKDSLPKGVAIVAGWCIGLWLLARERKKR